MDGDSGSVSGKKVMKILLIENKREDKENIFRLFKEIEDKHYPFLKEEFKIDSVNRLSEGLERIAREEVNMILVDSHLPDSQGSEILKKIYNEVPEIPVIMLVEDDNETAALEEVKDGGVCDYLIKNRTDSELLMRSLRYSFEKQHLISELQTAELIDKMTGLYNRNGFLVLARQQLKLMQRIGTGMFLLYLDYRHLKEINQNYDRGVGNRVLMEIASVLKKSFRDSDTIGRIGDDDFAVLGIETARVRAEILTGRLDSNIDIENQKGNFPFKLAVDSVVVRYDPQLHSCIDDMLEEAKDRLAEKKKNPA